MSLRKPGGEIHYYADPTIPLLIGGFLVSALISWGFTAMRESENRAIDEDRSRIERGRRTLPTPSSAKEEPRRTPSENVNE